MRPARDSIRFGPDQVDFTGFSRLNTLTSVFSNFNDQIVRIGSDDLVQRVDLLNHRRLRFSSKSLSFFRSQPPLYRFMILRSLLSGRILFRSDL
jgi:hypothetical protein